MVPRVLTIAGSDSGGGAGIQADLKTFLALGCHGCSAVTALTAQNTMGVTGVHEVPPEFVREQIDAVLGDIGADAVKTGMLSSAPIIDAVVAGLAAHRAQRIVVDPVFVSKHGATLLRADAVDALRDRLIPMATVITPNLPEASGLLGREVPEDEPPEDTAVELAALGCEWVVLKGGHYKTEESLDVLTNGREIFRFSAPRLATRHTHGTGCTLAAAIAAGLAHGRPVQQAVEEAKAFVHRAIDAHVRVGEGISPVNQAHAIWGGP